MRFTFFSLLLILGSSALAQSPEHQAPQYEVEAHLRFLASDELQGRRTGDPGNYIAARYIAENFRAFGAQPLPGADGYYQQFPLETVTPPQSSALKIGKSTYEHRKDYLMMAGNALTAKTTGVFAGHGWVDAATGHDDYKGLDVKGKVVFVVVGLPNDSNPMTAFNSISDKRRLAQERGAVAIIELYRLGFPWQFALQYFGKPSTRVGDDNPGGSTTIPYGWLKEKGNDAIAEVVKGAPQKIALSSSGASVVRQMVPNVVAVIPGSDPVLKDEYVLISAHFDHVGTGKNGGSPTTAEDSIFNGARDNAFGTSALLLAARTLAQQKTKRSIILLACNGEEMGLLGSLYYAEHPLIPLRQTIFNLNADGAGYNEATKISAIGYGRTGIDEHIEGVASAFGLGVIPNPVPEQGLFDRSDNVAFAAKGVPAVCISPGVTGFDEMLMKYYHQVPDEADSVDMPYLLRYCQSFALLARRIADDAAKPVWIKGDKYETAGMKLYQK